MKKIYVLIAFAMFAFVSCTSDDGTIGPPGPEGPQGPPGADGLIGAVFDVEGDFSASNEYTLSVNFADFTDVEVFESDVVLVYLRVGEDGTSDGEPVYVWRLLPQTYYVDGGTMQYNFDHTFFDAQIFLDADVPLSSLGTAFTGNQVFRIALLPAALATSNNVNISDYNSVMKALEFEKREIPQLELK